QQQKDILYPNEVRQILNSDNDEIKRLCKQVRIYPKRDQLTGKTFFMKDDIDFLKRIKELYNKGQNLLDCEDRTFQTPAILPKQNTPKALVDGNTLVKEFQNAIGQIILTQESMAEKLQNTLDSKLDGLDEVIVELIQIKTENENLRIKINQLTKQNYDLKTETESFKPVGLGFYTKQKNTLF
ncbi:MAG: hypothetical protein WC197_07920, partial [Candidatus Gastranaerophilaceae bacterium]